MAAAFVNVFVSASQSLFPPVPDGWQSRRWPKMAEIAASTLVRPVPLLSSVGGAKRLGDCLKILLSLASMERRRDMDLDELN